MIRYRPQQWQRMIVRHGSHRSKEGERPFQAPSAQDYRCAVTGCVNEAGGWHYIQNRKRKPGEARRVDLTNPEKPPKTKFIAKAVPLCEAHMTMVRNNTYQGPSLRKLKGISPNDGQDDILRHVKRLKKYDFDDK